MVAEHVKKNNTEISQKKENSFNDLSGLFTTRLPQLKILDKLPLILKTNKGVNGSEAIDKTNKKNHHGSPCELTTEVNLCKL